MNLLNILLVIFIVHISAGVRVAVSKYSEPKVFYKAAPTRKTFDIDPHSKGFLKDGKPFRYISGTIHYFRVLPDDWRDRLGKLKYAGFNTVETYVEWASHEPEPGVYNFEGGLDLFTYLDIAFEEGLLVILRPGPFIDAGRDMGGLPYWLLRSNPNMNLRTMDSSYIYYVDRWFNVLFPLLKPYIYSNGGPVIMVQVENDYGSYPACDFYYKNHLRDLAKQLLGTEVILFTTDSPNTYNLKCGQTDDVYSTIHFGPTIDVASPFKTQRTFEPNGPLVNSEYYSGWKDHWGERHNVKNAKNVAYTLDKMLALNASVNMYVFHGGTNFGLTSGSGIDERFQSCPTSFDFDAPLNEAGDPTEKYFAIRKVTQKYVELPPGKVPGPSDKYEYGDVQLFPNSEVFGLVKVLDTVANKWPLTFEELSVFNGIVVYSTKIPYLIPDPARLIVENIHDRGYVYVENEFVGIVTREELIYELPFFGKPHQKLTIIAESQGRVCFGKKINDLKGIIKNVTIGGTKLSDWEMTVIPVLNSTKLKDSIKQLHQKTHRQLLETDSGEMTFYEGMFKISSNTSDPKDTFLRLDGWTKGYAWINDFLLGRYWPVVGPQETLYIPKSLLQDGENSILLFELEKAPCSKAKTCKVSLVDTPKIDGATPKRYVEEEPNAYSSE